ncbi:hypothetical protein BLGI_982 [Brevibacillus laterosporus GI-9]|nr:hypothetical protein BLGI_982 [Brevibacillus laterosporus GI-9]
MQVGVCCLLFLTKPFPVTQIGAWQSIAIFKQVIAETLSIIRKEN